MEERSLKTQLDEFHPLHPEAWMALDNLLVEKKLQRQEFLVREGERPQHCYFLASGVVRVFFSKDGSEYNKTFFLPGSFPTPLTALLTDSPAELSFQALTECKLRQFSYRRFRALFGEHRSLEQLLLKILEQIRIDKELHDIRMVVNQATTNYLIFREEFPGLEQLIPQYHIASYLGITPIQLSRIRAQLLKAK